MLKELAKTLGALLYIDKVLERLGGALIFAILAGNHLLDSSILPGNIKSAVFQDNTAPQKGKEYSCQNGRSFKYHTQEPINYQTLKYAFTGQKNPLLKREISFTKRKKIQECLKQRKFRDMLQQLEKLKAPSKDTD